jgi:hypothetical protein
MEASDVDPKALQGLDGLISAMPYVVAMISIAG